MKLDIIKPNTALNRAYYKQSLNRQDVELFKTNLKRMFSRIDKSESEEHNKNIVSDFLKDTYYKPDYEINTARRQDLVVHLGKSNTDPVAVIIEAKSPSNNLEMINADKPNVKALHELAHYYLYERINNKNKEVRHLIITNAYEWFIFDAVEFEKCFYQSKSFRNTYQDWTDKKLAGVTTEWFYTEVAKPFMESELEKLDCVYINLQEYTEIITNEDQADDNRLINLYKILSPAHLLKLPFENDYNKIDSGFYNELLHILGLEETRQGGKKLITRINRNNRNAGSLLENTIGIIETKNRLKHIERLDLFGDNEEEQLFSVALELNITWLNRILFLKLLEAQLIKYHNGNNVFAFLNTDKVKDFDELDELFFEVLAKKPDDRTESVSEKFGDLPYLNSSLFEQTGLEDNVIYISHIKDRLNLPVSNTSILKDKQGKRLTGELNTLEYLFQFLNAYSFASDTTAEIQDDNRTIINAAVLGLIFEKINGYKDGSFYTPSFITTFISREILNTSIINKFSQELNVKIESFEHLKDLIDYTNKEIRQKANNIINSLKIVDPAVGSGHFLVSILNELISIKSELRILQYTNGNRIKGLKIENINDELEIIVEDTSESFQYSVNQKNQPKTEIQEIQQALFNEKRILIENCLFGVDINPKSVLICRLRLWIELLKNSYYTQESKYRYLETLPNIDINIKTGNSLISKFDTGLTSMERDAVNRQIIQYKLITDEYKNTTDYKQKEKFRNTIRNIKDELLKYAIPQDKHYRQFLKKSKELQLLIGIKPQSADITKQIVKLSGEVAELEEKYKENYYNVYANSLEWSIEFPEILSDNGNYIGFDIVLGNPPYFPISNEIKLKEVNENYKTFKQTGDIYMLFIERGIQILKPNGIICMITSNKWMRAAYGDVFREYLIKNTKPELLIDFGGVKIFDEATVDTSILFIKKYRNSHIGFDAVYFDKSFKPTNDDIANYVRKNKISLSGLSSKSWNIASNSVNTLKEKINKKGIPLEKWNIEINRGILTGYNAAFFIDAETKAELIAQDPKSENIIKPLLRGRDVHKYYIDKKDRFLIDSYNGRLIEKEDPITGKMIKVRKDRINIEREYPAIYKYLTKFAGQLESRADQGNHWTNHRNCAYQHLFYEEKIIYPETTVRRSEFYLDTDQYLVDKTCFIITGDNLRFLNGVLCSKLVEYYLETELRTLGKTSIQYSKQYMEKLPVPAITESNQSIVWQIEMYVNEILALKKLDIDTDISYQSKLINELVYQLYELTDNDIAQIESALI